MGDGDTMELEIANDKEITEDDQEASVIKFVNQIIWEAFKDRATDIHFEPAEDELRIRYRIDGILHQTPMPPQLKRYQAALISRIKVMSGMNIAEKRLPQDGRINVRIKGEEIDIRVSTVPTVYGESVSLRLLTRGKIFLWLDKLGFAPAEENAIREIILKPHGIFLVTGPTGSGKSTSLYAFLSSINSVTKRIITIEEPVEYELKGINQIAVRTDIGLTFAMGLRHILRQDPNVVMVGEIRDSETAEIAIRASLTGHLVFSTLHTNDAPSAFTRLIDMGIEPFLVASSVEAVMAQRLVRTICKHCKTEQKVDARLSAEHRFSRRRTSGRRKSGTAPVAKNAASWAIRAAKASMNCSRHRGHPPADHEPLFRHGHRPARDGGRDAHAPQRRLDQGQGRRDDHRGSPARDADGGTSRIAGRRRTHPVYPAPMKTYEFRFPICDFVPEVRDRLSILAPVTRQPQFIMARWHSCNILHTAPDANRLWQFDAKSGALSRESRAAAAGQPLPSRLVTKSWTSLWQPRLNVAWLPAENVFLRVIELPKSSFGETLSMVELQLEKLSPLPVTQIVWTLQVLPQSPAENLQTVIVVIVERKVVEEFLGKLEAQGYLADRLEAPMLDQLAATPADRRRRVDLSVAAERPERRAGGVVVWRRAAELEPTSCCRPTATAPKVCRRSSRNSSGRANSKAG